VAVPEGAAGLSINQIITISWTGGVHNWKHYQSYTPPVQRSAWRWPYSLAETCSWNYNI